MNYVASYVSRTKVCTFSIAKRTCTVRPSCYWYFKGLF